MIKLYTWTTPNGRKVSIALEELGLEYSAIPVDINKGEQREAAFLDVSPNGRIPAIEDTDTGVRLMESGAILLYLAEKTGRLLPPSGEARFRVVEWLMWQMGGLGPMLGQAHHFLHYHPEASVYANQRYGAEARRLYGVLDRRLEGRRFIVGDYSIADIAVWPWVARHDWQEIDLRDFPNVRRWYEAIADRPAVQKGYDVPFGTGPVPRP